MMERKFVMQKKKEFRIQEFIAKTLPRVGQSKIKLQRTPLGDKIVIYASRPGLVVGTKGQNITKLTAALKKKFSLENPQIEIGEVDNISLDATIMAEKIASLLERFGTSKFKGVGHKVIQEVMDAGALGIEIVISGKIPGSRAKSWRFYQGYLKKCGDIATAGVDTAHSTANLKTGTVGIKVSIMPPTIRLPDKIGLLAEPEQIVEEIKEEIKEEAKEGEKAEASSQKPETSEKSQSKEEEKEKSKAEEKPKKQAKKKSKEEE